MTNRVQFSNLPQGTDKDAVRRMCASVADTVSVELPLDEQTGGAGGSAFVTFSSASGAQYAVIKLSGYTLNGNTIGAAMVEEIRVQPTWSRYGSRP